MILQHYCSINGTCIFAAQHIVLNVGSIIYDLFYTFSISKANAIMREEVWLKKSHSKFCMVRYSAWWLLLCSTRCTTSIQIWIILIIFFRRYTYNITVQNTNSKFSWELLTFVRQSARKSVRRIFWTSENISTNHKTGLKFRLMIFFVEIISANWLFLQTFAQ